MINFFYNLNGLTQTVIVAFIAFLSTTLGASIIFLFKDVKKEVMNFLLSISSGIMLAASIFSLLIPAIDAATNINLNPLLIVPTSILLGTLILILFEKLINKKLNKNQDNVFLLVISIILHNIPEGASMGIAFASIIYGLNDATIVSALSLSFAIIIQNFPEGASISLPLKNNGYSNIKAFLIGSLTGIVEPIAAIIGYFLVLKIQIFLPILLSVAASAMLMVIIMELIPESMNSKYKTLMAYATILGFSIMMILELI